MRRNLFAFTAISIAHTLVASSALGACSATNVSKVSGAASAVHANGRVYFRTSGLELDFDGSPRAYGVRDQGEENICVGLAPLAAPCHGQYQGACYKVCQKTFAAWSRTSGDPQELPDTMCSVGLGGGGCSRPDVRLQAAPNQAWFVSETSLKASPITGKADAAWLQSQDAQLDPAKIHFLVVPGALTRAPWNVRFGDVGMAFNALTKQPVPFIVGDGGGLGEGSVSLLAALSPDQPPQLKKVTSALGEQVMRYTRGIEGDFRFVIFPGTASNRTDSTHKVVTQTAAKLPGWIEDTAGKGFKASSIQEVAKCSGLAPAISK